MDNVDEFLAHYGVKGMKWGVRRAASLAERSAANSESTPYRQARIDTKARKAATKATGKGSTAPKQLTRGVIKERMAADPAYKAAKQKYDNNVLTGQAVKVAAVALGIAASPHILVALDNYSRANVTSSIHKVIYKEFEKSAYGQARRERGKQFIDNSNYDVVNAIPGELVRTR